MLRARPRIRIKAQSGARKRCRQVTWPSSLQVPRTPRPGVESADSRRLASKHSRKALKASLTLGILLGMFFVTWLPFFVANIVQVMLPLGVGESPPCWGGPESHHRRPRTPRAGEGGGRAATQSACLRSVTSTPGGVPCAPAPGCPPAPSRPCVAASPWGSLTSSRGWATATAP